MDALEQIDREIRVRRLKNAKHLLQSADVEATGEAVVAYLNYQVLCELNTGLQDVITGLKEQTEQTASIAATLADVGEGLEDRIEKIAERLSDL